MRAGHEGRLLLASRQDLEAFLAEEVHPNHFLMCTLLQKRLFVRDGFNPKSEESLEEMVAVGEKLLGIVTGSNRYSDFTLRDRLALVLG